MSILQVWKLEDYRIRIFSTEGDAIIQCVSQWEQDMLVKFLSKLVEEK